MNLKIITKTENEAVIEFIGEGHTILNLLRTELLNDERVLMATYDTKFPVMDNPVFRITTSGVDPIIVLKEATRRIIDQCEEFSQTVRGSCAVIRHPKHLFSLAADVHHRATEREGELTEYSIIDCHSIRRRTSFLQAAKSFPCRRRRAAAGGWSDRCLDQYLSKGQEGISLSPICMRHTLRFYS